MEYDQTADGNPNDQFPQVFIRLRYCCCCHCFSPTLVDVMGVFLIRQSRHVLQHLRNTLLFEIHVPQIPMAIDIPHLPTRIVAADKDSIALSGKLLREGRLVAFPTETVYGLGANALDAEAVAAIFAAKERPRFNPLIVHVHDREEADDLVQFHPLASALAEAFWPGGLTLVLPRREPCPLALLVSGGLPPPPLRAPPHPLARALGEAAGGPLAAPSANRAGRISPTSAADAAGELQGRVDLILDGGPCPLGIESTVVGFAGERPILFRPGAVPRGDIETLIGPLLDPDRGAIQAP